MIRGFLRFLDKNIKPLVTVDILKSHPIFICCFAAYSHLQSTCCAVEVDLPSLFEESSEPVVAVNTPTLHQAVPLPSPRTSFSAPLNRSMKHLSVNAPPPPSPTGVLTPGATDVPDSPSEKAPLVLRNKCPRWHEQLQCWCLNFRGRVTVASVKNFQLVAAGEPAGAGQAGPEVDKVG